MSSRTQPEPHHYEERGGSKPNGCVDWHPRDPFWVLIIRRRPRSDKFRREVEDIAGQHHDVSKIERGVRQTYRALVPASPKEHIHGVGGSPRRREGAQ